MRIKDGTPKLPVVTSHKIADGSVLASPGRKINHHTTSIFTEDFQFLPKAVLGLTMYTSFHYPHLLGSSGLCSKTVDLKSFAETSRWPTELNGTAYPHHSLTCNVIAGAQMLYVNQELLNNPILLLKSFQNSRWNVSKLYSMRCATRIWHSQPRPWETKSG